MLTIARIELRRAFFSKRALWVYLLALFPSIVFFGHGLETKMQRNRWSARGLTPAAVIDGIREGDREADVAPQLTERAFSDRKWTYRRRVNRSEGNKQIWEMQPVQMRSIQVFDGQRRAQFHFENGILRGRWVRQLADFEEDREVYAGIFQYFYLRLAIFFGCLGIFMNLFRGEMLDKTLHFWLLAPVRREVLLAGKYVAGLAAAMVIFTGGALLCFGAMLWPHDPAEVQAYWQSVGASHAFWYAAAAALGCVGYGSVFLAAGLLLKNPVVPAAALLVWESVNSFLPSLLQKVSILHYLQSLCPVPAPMDKDAPSLVRLLLSPAAPTSTLGAVLGLLILTVLVLWMAARISRRLEISYSTE